MKLERFIFDKFSFLLRPLYGLYSKKSHSYDFRGLNIKTLPNIFNPILFHSSIDLIDYIDSLSIEQGKLLELGCGSGMASIYFANKKWKVTASDVNAKALKNASQNANRNNVRIDCIESDLFQELGNLNFDVIFINPPYFPKEAKNIDEKAWFCGSSFEYYENLFSQVRERKNKGEVSLMVLSEKCKIEKIESIASKNNILMDEKKRSHHSYEDIVIFELIQE